MGNQGKHIVVTHVPPTTIKGKASDPLPCWKLAYASERDALTAPCRKPMRAYHCVLCGAWHRTERVQKKRRSITK